MISEGEEAPGFRLPGVVDGEIREFDLDDYLGDSVVVVAFYPGDFNPGCTETESDLDDVDLLSMQDDVAVFGVAPDTVYSHRAFAAEYDLDMTLLSDPRGDVIEAYGFDREGEAGAVTARRAVVVVAHDGTVEYVWTAEGDHDTPAVDRIRAAIADIGDDTTALERYRVGHAHYVEGRRSFTSAMGEYEDQDWLMAQTDFERAQAEFEQAAEEFATTARFLDVEDVTEVAKRADRKATALWQAAEWLADSANACANGRGAEGMEFREDATAPLETARDIDEPPEPEEFRASVARAREAPEEAPTSDSEAMEDDGDLSYAVAGVAENEGGGADTPDEERAPRPGAVGEPEGPVDEGSGDAAPEPEQPEGSRYSQSRWNDPGDADDEGDGNDGDLELDLDDPDPDPDGAESGGDPSREPGPPASAGPDIVPSDPGEPADAPSPGGERDPPDADDRPPAGANAEANDGPGTAEKAETATGGDTGTGTGTDGERAEDEGAGGNEAEDAPGEETADDAGDDGEIVLDLKDPTEGDGDDGDGEGDEDGEGNPG